MKTVEDIHALLPPTELPHVVVEVKELRLAAMMKIAAADVTRPVLNALLMEMFDEGIRITAADGFQAARIGTMEGVVLTGGDHLIRASGLLSLQCCRAINIFKGLARISLGPNRVVVENGYLRLEALYAVEGGHKYPDLDMIIPGKPPETICTIKTDELARIMRVISIALKGFRPPGVVFDIGEDHVGLYSISLPSMELVIAAEVEGENTAVALSPKLLLNGLRLCGPETTMHVCGPSKAVTIDVPRGIYLLMPVHGERAERPSSLWEQKDGNIDKGDPGK